MKPAIHLLMAIACGTVAVAFSMAFPRNAARDDRSGGSKLGAGPVCASDSEGSNLSGGYSGANSMLAYLRSEPKATKLSTVRAISYST